MHLWVGYKGGYASAKARAQAEKMIPNEVKKIALIRHAAIGDLVIMRPLILELRSLFPHAEITLSLVGHYQYGAPVDMVDHVHVVYKKVEGKKTSFFNRIKQMKELGEQDIIIDLADSALSMWTTLLNSAKLKIGYPFRLYRRKMYDIVLERSDFVLETENMLHFANLFGARTQRPFNYAYPEYPRQLESPYICYFTSASEAFKCWPKKDFIKLIHNMALRYPHMKHIIMEGIRDDEKVDDMLKELAEFENVSKQSALPLEEAMPYLGKASMVISNDTGVRNMAIAVNTPTVGIFFATGPFRYWPREPMHEVVFEADASVPSIEHVFEICSRHLQTVFAKTGD
mgnify:CR=1 FL=1